MGWAGLSGLPMSLFKIKFFNCSNDPADLMCSLSVFSKQTEFRFVHVVVWGHSVPLPQVGVVAVRRRWRGWAARPCSRRLLLPVASGRQRDDASVTPRSRRTLQHYGDDGTTPSAAATP